MKLTRTTRNAGWLIVAGLLGAALIAPAGVSASDPVPATVTGHEKFSENANHERYWEAKGYEDCTKLDKEQGEDFLLEQSYGLVVVKAGAGEFANTLFENAAAGETVWADTNGDFEYNPGGKDGDKDISHIIFCDPATTTTTTTEPSTTTTTTTVPSTTTTTSAVETETTDDTTTTTQAASTTTKPSGSVAGETGKPTPPSTDTVDFSSTSSTTGSGWSLLLIAMAGLLAGALLLTPAAAARKR